MLHRAVFACDFARYQPPFEAGPRAFVSDVNLCYKRRALEATRALWRDRYHETTVHWALLRAGETLHLDPAPRVIEIRGPLDLRALIRERFDWGRLFAYTRARESSGRSRALRIALAPLLPFLLWARIVHRAIERRLPLAPTLAASPAMLLLLIAWSAGEGLGDWTGRP